MTDVREQLATFNDRDVYPEHPSLWVVGPHGAVSTKLSACVVMPHEVGRFASISAYGTNADGRPIEVSSFGFVWHWPAQRPDPPGVDPMYREYNCMEKEACEFLETHCRHWIGSSRGHAAIEAAYARGDVDAVYAILKDEYREFFITGYEELTHG